MTLILLCMAPDASAQRMKKTAESFMVDAVQLYNDGNHKAARAMLSSVVESDPENDAAYYYAALCDIYLNNAKDAEAELKEAIRLSPDNYWYKDRLASLYLMTGKFAETISIYEELVKDHPKKIDLYYNLVNLYAQTGRLPKVLTTLDEIEAMTGKDETTTLARYDILMHMDKADAAVKVLQDFSDEYYASPNILSRLGDASLTDYKDTLALKYYDEALKDDPSYVPAILGKADVFRYRRSFDEYFGTLNGFMTSPEVPGPVKTQYLKTLTDQLDGRFATQHMLQLDSLYETGVAQCPKDSSMLMTAATYYFRSDRPRRGNQLFKANAELYPDAFSAVATYVQALNVSEEWEELKEACDMAFARFPEEAAFLSIKGLADYQLGDFHAVIADSQRMIDSFPNDEKAKLEAFATIGDTYHMLGEEVLAYKAYDKALKIDPEYVPVLNNYAYYLSMSRKKLKKAYAMSKITVEKEPDNATYLDTFAWILHLQGKSLEAKSFFKHAMLYGGKDSATILDHYAEVLYALKEYELAGVYWDMAKKKNIDNDIPGLDEKIEARMKAAKK